MRYHLHFKNLHPTVLRAADELFLSKPWTGTDEERYVKFRTFLQRASDAYSVPAPSFEVDTAGVNHGLALQRMQYDLGQIDCADFSVISTFLGLRAHLQALNVANIDGLSEAEDNLTAQRLLANDAVGWACSLFYTVRPTLFRKAVRSGVIQFVAPIDLLSSATQERYWAGEVDINGKERTQVSPLDEDGVAYIPEDDGDEPPMATTGALDQEAGPAPYTTNEVMDILGRSRSYVCAHGTDLGGTQDEAGRWTFARAAIDTIAQEQAQQG